MWELGEQFGEKCDLTLTICAKHQNCKFGLTVEGFQHFSCLWQGCCFHHKLKQKSQRSPFAGDGEWLLSSSAIPREEKLNPLPRAWVMVEGWPKPLLHSGRPCLEHGEEEFRFKLIRYCGQHQSPHFSGFAYPYCVWHIGIYSSTSLVFQYYPD